MLQKMLWTRSLLCLKTTAGVRTSCSLGGGVLADSFCSKLRGNSAKCEDQRDEESYRSKEEGQV